MRRDPRPRRDGLCALRTCRKPVGKRAKAHGDPFHTSLCCRQYHGVVFSSDDAAEKYAESRGGRIDKPTAAGRAHMNKAVGRRT